MAKFISLEGIEFTGKSTLASSLEVSFKKLGFIVDTAHDPGTTEKAKQIRLEVFKKTHEGAKAMTIADLYMQARADLANELIIPFMTKHQHNKKAIFISDRFLDSTRVYIGLNQDVPMTQIFAMEKKYLGSLLPDITLICYFNSNCFEEELEKRRDSTIEKRQRENNTSIWHHSNLHKMKLRQDNYLKVPQLARRHGEHRIFELIDVCQSVETVLQDARTRILSHVI